jgi:hypothetical protein
LVKKTLEAKNGVFSFEDKMIIQSALSIWAGSLVAKPELFEKTKNFSGLEELITSGLLYCHEDSIKDSFRHSLMYLAQYHKTTTEQSSSSTLGFLLCLLSKKFAEIGNHPCR